MNNYKKNIKVRSLQTPIRFRSYDSLIPQFSNFVIFSILILNSTFLISQNSLDQLQYNYSPNTNQLKYIYDAIGATASTADLDDQNRTNYTYNHIGQLTQDKAEGILDIDWTAAGKVKQVSIDDDNDLVADRTLQFKYDGMGNRIKKIETFLTTLDPQLTTFYLRNAGGEIISIYEGDGTATNRVEISINGVGTDKIEENISSSGVYSRKTGNKNYELKDHIGNVRVTVSDTKEPNLGLTTFNSQLTTSADYYAFGMEMSGRTMSSAEGYRYGFNGKEKDDELKGSGNSYDFGARLLDPRVGRWLSRDPLAEKFADMSPYNSMNNNPANMVDPDGAASIALVYLWEIYKQDGLTVTAGEALTFTDADDVSVLMTGMHTNGDEAGYLDYGLAAAGTLLPVVAGGVVLKLVKNVPNAKTVEKTVVQAGEGTLSSLMSKGIDPAAIAKINYKNGGQNCMLTTLSMDEYLASGKAWTVDGSHPGWDGAETFLEQAGVEMSIKNIGDLKSIDAVLQEGDRAVILGRRVDALGAPATGHVFNATKIDGKTIYIDAQLGRIVHADDIAGEGYSSMDLAITGKIGDRKP